jgi:CheY-like chemotaxis protein
MSREIQARIFDPFFSTKESGRGLGLAALRGILKAHGAGVCIRSEVGAGTTFEVFFPAGADARAEGSDKPVRAARPSLRSIAAQRGEGAVLLVDDARNVRFCTRALLEHLGFSVIEATNGAEAVDVFRAERAGIACVLMDLTMPGLDGYTAFLRLREIDSTVPVVLSSGWAETELSRRFAECPPAGFLAKPFTPDQLSSALARLGLTAADSAAS